MQERPQARELAEGDEEEKKIAPGPARVNLVDLSNRCSSERDNIDDAISEEQAVLCVPEHIDTKEKDFKIAGVVVFGDTDDNERQRDLGRQRSPRVSQKLPLVVQSGSYF